MLQNETNGLDAMLHNGALHNLVICLNPSPISDSLLALDLRNVDLLVMNDIEARSLAGDSADGWERDIRNRCPRATIVRTRGSLGGEVLTPDSDAPILYRSRSVKTVDTTAAGDTFLGYLVAGISRGESLKPALNRAARAAERCVTVKGSQTSIPWFKEL